jgi:hypothetical protein
LIEPAVTVAKKLAEARLELIEPGSCLLRLVNTVVADVTEGTPMILAEQKSHTM